MLRTLALAACLLATGCTYYSVTDPASGKVYYTDNWNQKRHDQSGAIRFKDAATGDEVTLQSSQVRKISEERFKEMVNPAQP